jgi:hypothetical protein
MSKQRKKRSGGAGSVWTAKFPKYGPAEMARLRASLLAPGHGCTRGSFAALLRCASHMQLVVQMGAWAVGCGCVSQPIAIAVTAGCTTAWLRGMRVDDCMCVVPYWCPR